MEESNTILNEPEVVYAARKGINRQKVNEIIALTGFSLNEMGKYTHVTPRTLQRKNLTEILPSNISEKVILIQNLYIKGSKVLGSLEAFKTWMCASNISMGGAIPKDFLDTFTGVEFLMHELGRIEHGFVA